MKYLFIIFFVCGVIYAQTPIKFNVQSRKILVLYDSSHDTFSRPDRSLFHRSFEFPLNYIGLTVDYFDVNDNRYPEISQYRGLFVWFAENRIHDPNRMLKYLINGFHLNIPLICINSMHYLEDDNGVAADDELIKKFHELFGIEYIDEQSSSNPFLMNIIDNDETYFKYETTFSPEILTYPKYRKMKDDVNVLRYVTEGDDENAMFPVVTVSSRGGWTADSSFLFRVRLRPDYQLFWDIDPIRFLRESYSIESFPIPDTTTVNSLRAAFSHIDGDSFENVTHDISKKQKLCGEVIYNEILKEYPYPVSVSFITSLIDPEIKGSIERVKIARDILNLPHIQAASHAYSHPMSWEEGIVGIQIPGYTFNDRDEIDLSIKYINKHLCPPGKNVDIFLWTGNCIPVEKTLAYIKEKDILAMNGGDPVYDEMYPSLTNICPRTRPVGDQIQIYACSRNDYIYTKGWTENFGGFSNVINTFERSEKPMRLLPVNIYYHFFIGERKASLESLKRTLNWCRNKELCWIHASEYVKSVKGFVTAEHGKTSDGRFFVRNFGELKTVRFDNCSKKVDMKKSVNVTGFDHTNTSLYVGIKGERAIIALSDFSSAVLCVKKSTAVLKDVDGNENMWNASARWYSLGYIQIQGAQAQRSYACTVDQKDMLLTADNSGIITIPLEVSHGKWVSVKIEEK